MRIDVILVVICSVSILLTMFRWQKSAWGYSLAIGLLTIFMVWGKFPQFLYLSRDGAYNNFLTRMYFDWADPLDVTAINPLSGMVSMLVAHNPYFLPAEYIRLIGLDVSDQNLIIYAIYGLEVLVSTFFLSKALNLTTLTSVFAAVAASLFLLPPFNFMFGFAGWFTAAPMYGHAVALTNISIIILIKIDDNGNIDIKKRKSILNYSILIALIVTISLAFFVSSPFYFAGMFVGALLLFACTIMSSRSWATFRWRVAAVLAIFVGMLVLKFPEFYLATKSYSARFASGKPFLGIDLAGAQQWSNSQAWEAALSRLCAYGVWCPPSPGWPVSISPHWIYASAIAGGLAFALIARRGVARLGLAFAALWSALLVFWILQAVDVISFALSPSFLFLMIFPALAIFTVCIYLVPLEIIAKKYGHDRLGGISPLVVFISASCALIYISSFFSITPIDVAKRAVEPPRHYASAITDILVREISLRPGALFRGSVATILGVPEGSIRSAIAVDAAAPVAEGQFESFLAAAAKTGSTHDLLDFWHFDIPTISEYGQGISPPLAFYEARFLKSEADASQTHFIMPKKLNRDVLRAMGARFIVVDAAQNDENLLERGRLAAPNGVQLFLYETTNPNLGSYAPTKLAPIESADVFAARVAENPNILESTAFVENPPEGQLQPIVRSELIFEKRGIRVRAKSLGRSALLLPVQFSNCYTVKPLFGNAVIQRANLLHTLVLFEGEMDIRLRWSFSFWRGSSCRAKDVRDLENYALRPIAPRLEGGSPARELP